MLTSLYDGLAFVLSEAWLCLWLCSSRPKENGPPIELHSVVTNRERKDQAGRCADSSRLCKGHAGAHARRPARDSHSHPTGLEEVRLSLATLGSTALASRGAPEFRPAACQHPSVT